MWKLTFYHHTYFFSLIDQNVFSGVFVNRFFGISFAD